MSRGAKPVAVALGLAAFLSAGIASACPGHATHSASAPASDAVTSTQPAAPTQGGVRG
jgi:hypothetical protein